MNKISILFFLVSMLLAGCKNHRHNQEKAKLKIIIDSDTNNELDDQHALAYAFLNLDIFDIEGITVNNTRGGNGIQGQYDEAKRIIQLFNLETKILLLKGAEKSFAEIIPEIKNPEFDSNKTVDFIIEKALQTTQQKLILLPIGKLTNITLTIQKEPRIINNIKII